MKKWSGKDEAINKAFEETGAFFAFGQKQFDEKADQSLKYVSLGAGLVCPKKTATVLVETMNEISNKSRDFILQNNSIDDIIQYELSNHEFCITEDIEPTADAVEYLGITPEQIIQYVKENPECRYEPE